MEVDHSKYFLDNRYTNLYFKLIDRARTRVKPKCYVERHHVIPKALAENDDVVELVTLTAKEHYLCHVLLVKMVNTFLHKRSMYYAVYRFHKTQFNQKKFTGAMYAFLREASAKLTSGKNNPFFGKTHTIESREMMGKSRPGKENPFYGKSHSEETKQLLSQKTAAYNRSRTYKCGPYKLISPSGEVSYLHKNLAQFCKDHGMTTKTFVTCCLRGYKLRGWTITHLPKGSILTE